MTKLRLRRYDRVMVTGPRLPSPSFLPHLPHCLASTEDFLPACSQAAEEEEEMDPPDSASRVFCSRILSMVNTDDVNAIILAQKNM